VPDLCSKPGWVPVRDELWQGLRYSFPCEKRCLPPNATARLLGGYSPHQKRDLAVGAYEVASALESAADPCGADYWAKARDTLAALPAAGKLPESNRSFLDHVTGELGPK
jgi:hypothetical protein